MNSEGHVLFTIQGFEIVHAPDAEPVAIMDGSLEEWLMTTGQVKVFPDVPFSLASEDSLNRVVSWLNTSALLALLKMHTLRLVC